MTEERGKDLSVAADCNGVDHTGGTKPEEAMRVRRAALEALERELSEFLENERP
jgi:hypothetical protein